MRIYGTGDLSKVAQRSVNVSGAVSPTENRYFEIGWVDGEPAIRESWHLKGMGPEAYIRDLELIAKDFRRKLAVVDEWIADARKVELYGRTAIQTKTTPFDTTSDTTKLVSVSV